MWETMYNAHGVGLAAPQIGLSIRLFVIDTLQMKDEGEANDGFKKVFINKKYSSMPKCLTKQAKPGLTKKAA